jgi:predicted transposase/invertase (TIGR01784 family)
LTNKEKRAKINEIVKHKEGIAMASETLSNISASQREYLLRLSEEKYILDAKSKRIQAWRKGLAEGRAEGLTLGRTEGRAEGMSLGRAEGKAEGLTEGMTKVARNMKSMGFSVEQIRQATGLSSEEIEKAAMG